MTFRFCTWNVDYYNRKGASLEDRRRFLREIDADAIALQEVRGRHASRYASLGPSCFGSEHFPGRNTSRWMVSGLLFRESSAILEHGVVPTPQREQRSVWARVLLAGRAEPITFVSWHSQHGVNLPSEYKMGYFATMSDWLSDRRGPVVLGADINTWVDPVDLRAADPADAYAIEHAFVGLDPEHGLRDAYRLMLEQTGRLDALRGSEPDGPLFVSHNGTPTRRDRILVSTHLRVIDSAYDTERGFQLSDHAPHWAVLDTDVGAAG